MNVKSLLSDLQQSFGYIPQKTFPAVLYQIPGANTQVHWMTGSVSKDRLAEVVNKVTRYQCGL